MANKPIPNPLPADLPTDWEMSQIISPGGTEVGLSEQHGYNYLSAAINTAQTAVNSINNAFEGLSDQQDLSVVMSGANSYFVTTVTEIDGAQNQYDFTVSNYTVGEPAMLIFKSPIPAGESFLFTINGQHPEENPAKWYQVAFSDLTTNIIGLWAEGVPIPVIISDVVGENGNILAFVPAGAVRSTLIPPMQSGILTYNGSTQSPTWSGYDSTKMTIGGTTSGVNAGSYIATFTPKGNYAWTDGTTSEKQVTWTIKRASVILPAQSGSLTFNGQSQSPAWTTYDPNAMTISGTTNAVNAGSYSATFTPDSNHCWTDSTTSAKQVTWTIGKATGSLSLNVDNLALNFSNPTGIVAVTRAGDGTISAVSNTPGVAQASVSGTNVVVTALATGSAIVTVSVAETLNYTAPAPKTIQVTAQMINPTLDANSWAQINAVSQSGQASQYWQLGAEKNIQLSTGEVLTLVILGFNHDDLTAGGKAGITFGLKNLMSETRPFNENLGNRYYNSPLYIWMRDTVFPRLPADLQAVIKEANKKVSVGVGYQVDTYPMKLFQFSEEEIFGITTYSTNGQGIQYDYFATESTRKKALSNGTGSFLSWWERSSDVKKSGFVCVVTANGAPSSEPSNENFGICFGFCV